MDAALWKRGQKLSAWTRCFGEVNRIKSYSHSWDALNSWLSDIRHFSTRPIHRAGHKHCHSHFVSGQVPHRHCYARPVRCSRTPYHTLLAFFGADFLLPPTEYRVHLEYVRCHNLLSTAHRQLWWFRQYLVGFSRSRQLCEVRYWARRHQVRRAGLNRSKTVKAV